MGCKSTQNITRADAEELYVRLRMEQENLKRQLRSEAVLMDDIKLENELERLDDAAHEGESFRNYAIVEKFDL